MTITRRDKGSACSCVSVCCFFKRLSALSFFRSRVVFFFLCGKVVGGEKVVWFRLIMFTPQSSSHCSVLFGLRINEKTGKVRQETLTSNDTTECLKRTCFCFFRRFFSLHCNRYIKKMQAVFSIK